MVISGHLHWILEYKRRELLDHPVVFKGILETVIYIVYIIKYLSKYIYLFLYRNPK